jgi:hypothetical protein
MRGVFAGFAVGVNVGGGVVVATAVGVAMLRQDRIKNISMTGRKKCLFMAALKKWIDKLEYSTARACPINFYINSGRNLCAVLP